MQDALPAPRVAFWQGPNTPGKKSLSLSSPSCSTPFRRAPRKQPLSRPQTSFLCELIAVDSFISAILQEATLAASNGIESPGNKRKLCQTPCSEGRLWAVV